MIIMNTHGYSNVTAYFSIRAILCKQWNVKFYVACFLIRSLMQYSQLMYLNCSFLGVTLFLNTYAVDE